MRTSNDDYGDTPEEFAEKMQDKFERETNKPPLMYYGGQKWYNPLYVEWMNNELYIISRACGGCRTVIQAKKEKK